MLCLRLKLLQITNLHICIKLGNGHSIKTVNITLVVTLKVSTSGQAQSILQRNTADFHGDGYFLQNTGHEAEEISFVVCDVNSEQKRLQVEFLFWSEFFIWTTKNEQNWLYTKDQKQKKNGNNAQFHYPSIQNIFLLPLWEPVLPLCAILRAKSR